MEENVGLDCMLSQVWNWLQEENIGIIGLWGIGGVSKTTLLRKINEDFLRTSHEFHVVLWIVVSKQVNLEKIRENIRNDWELDMMFGIIYLKTEQELHSYAQFWI